MVSEQRTFTVKDVIEAAQFRGELRLPWKELLERSACETASDSNPPDDTLLQRMSEEYRFERDLITAEETESWLAERGLTLDDFGDYLLRHHLNECSGKQTASAMIDYCTASQELRDLLRVELLLGGEFDRMAVRLSWRIAALHCSGHELTSDLIDPERRRFLERFGLDDARLGEWLARLGCDQTWLNEMVELESAYRRQCETLCTTQTRERTLSMLRLTLTRLDLETIEVESRETAREAFLCVSEDGISMAEVASEGRYPYHRAEVVLEDLPVASQRQILCAAPGEVLDPMQHGDGFQLVRLVRKIDPDLSNPEVSERVERQILESHFSELAAKWVRWMIPLSSTLEGCKEQE